MESLALAPKAFGAALQLRFAQNDNIKRLAGHGRDSHFLFFFLSVFGVVGFGTKSF